MTYTRLYYRRSKSKTAKLYQGEAPARLTAAINRYHCGMTVGHGWYRKFTHTDPIGSACRVLGWFSDGRVNAALPAVGVGIIGRADVAVNSWPDYVTSEQRAEWDSLPSLSLIDNGEIKTA